MFKSYGSYFCIGYLVHILILLDLALSTTAYKNLSSDFRTHSIVRPKLQHGRTKREITSTKHSTGSHHPEVTLTVSIDGEEHELELRLNEELVPRGHTLSYQQGGETRVHAPGKEELDICQYSGLVRGKPGSWAAVSTCSGVRGVIYDGKHMRYIEPKKDKVINADHFLYSHEHLAQEHRCGSEDAATRNSSSSSRYKRKTFEDTLVRPPYNVNTRSRYVELVLVADNHEFRASGGDLYIVHQHMKDLANVINSVYAPLNIFIALVGVEVWSEYNKIQLAEDSGKMLNDFARYRETELSRRIPNDNAHLLTRQEFTGGVVGKALVGVMCSHKLSAGIATDHSEVIGLVAMTIAHEMGHNFGMNHDDEKSDCSCPGPKCIMSSVSAAWITPVHWSSCSLRSLALSFEKGLDYCLRNKPARLLGPPTCGNGFLEEGEQCDCGTVPGELAPRDEDRSACTKCCKPDCTLRANATCGHGECCDLTTCNYKAVATECRSAERECDLPEFCSGKSQFCPQDFHKMDTTPCRNNQGYCMRGWCRSHEDQCRLLWGSTGVNADDKCYSMTNGKGNIYGNCGYDTNGRPRACAPQDVACGMLHCHHYNDRLQYGIESATTMKSFLQFSDHLIAPCHAAVTGLGAGPNDDPGLVPDGAKCGTDKMCMDHKCQSVARVRAAMSRQGFICPSNCSGHGVCNSNGNCHCDPGFAPPLCDSTGPGGSIDSLPITDIRGSKIFMVVMYVVFLGIIPAIVLVLVLIYCFCPNALPSWMKPRGSYAHNLFGATNLNGCCSKFKLPNFSSFGNLLRKSSKKVIRDCKSELTLSKLVVDSTPTNTKTITLTTKSVVDVDDNQVYANVSNFIRPSCNIEATNATTAHITNMQNIKSVGLNRKINKEDIAIVENYKNHVGVHKNAAFNLDANIKPKPDITINKLKTPSSAENSLLTSPNVEDLNNPKIEVVKNNYKPQTKGHTSINRPLLRPAPNIPSVNSKPSVNNKPTVSLKPNDKPVVSLKPKPSTMLSDESKPKTKIINDQVSTTNELVNQRAKLRKVTNRDVTK